jgi:hypothetical protein
MPKHTQFLGVAVTWDKAHLYLRKLGKTSYHGLRGITIQTNMGIFICPTKRAVYEEVALDVAVEICVAWEVRVKYKLFYSVILTIKEDV